MLEVRAFLCVWNHNLYFPFEQTKSGIHGVVPNDNSFRTLGSAGMKLLLHILICKI